MRNCGDDNDDDNDDDDDDNAVKNDNNDCDNDHSNGSDNNIDNNNISDENNNKIQNNNDNLNAIGYKNNYIIKGQYYGKEEIESIYVFKKVIVRGLIVLKRKKKIKISSETVNQWLRKTS